MKPTKLEYLSLVTWAFRPEISLWGSVTGKLEKLFQKIRSASSSTVEEPWKSSQPDCHPKRFMEMVNLLRNYKSLTPFWNGFSYSSTPFGVFLRNRQERNPSRRPAAPTTPTTPATCNSLGTLPATSP